MKKSWLSSLVISLILIFALPVRPAQATVTVRFATAAPDGSLQVKVMRAMARLIEKETDGAVRFQLFAGGTVGDDLGVIRQIQLGHLDGAGFSGVGVGSILSDARVLEIPFIFESESQVDCVRDKLGDYFSKRFEEQGYTLLGWADVGSVYLFSRHEIKSVDDMGETKPWVYRDDPVGTATFRAFNLSPTALQLQDVLTSLQTRLIDTFYITPALSIALQWNTHASYMIDTPLVNGMGAVLVKTEVLEQISPEHQKIIKDIFEKQLPRLVRATRRQNQESIALMEKQGLTKIDVPDEELKRFREVGRRVARTLAGDVYPSELLDRVLKLIPQCK